MKLDGIRVIDLSRFLPGPYITLAMADHGAEVIKIETHAGEPTRHLGPKIKGHSAYFRNTQRGKRSLRINLKAPEGRDVFLKLADRADVIIDSFRPGVVERLGIDYDTVSKRNPRIIYCALSAFGQSGSMASRPSHDLGAQALTGTLSLGQSDGRAPGMPPAVTADVALGSLSLAGIAMALYRREQTGHGDYLDMAMTDSLMSWNPHIISHVIAHNEPPRLEEERLYGGAAFYNIYKTRDNRYIVLSGAEMNFVENLLTALERPDLIDCCRQSWGKAQLPAREFLTNTFAERTLAEWDTWLADKSVCYAPVLNLAEAWQHPYFHERGIVETGRDGVERLGTPIRFQQEPGAASDKLGNIGEDNDAILRELGYTEAARAELRDKDIC